MPTNGTQGVDVMLQHTDSPAPLIAAEKRGLRAIGQPLIRVNLRQCSHFFLFAITGHLFYVKTTQAVNGREMEVKQEFLGWFQG